MLHRAELTNSAAVITPSTRRLITGSICAEVQVDGKVPSLTRLRTSPKSRQSPQQPLPVAVGPRQPAKDAFDRKAPSDHGGVKWAQHFGEAELRAKSLGGPLQLDQGAQKQREVGRQDYIVAPDDFQQGGFNAPLKSRS